MRLRKARRAECLIQVRDDVAHVARQILPRQAQREIGEQGGQKRLPALLREKIFRERSRHGAKTSLGLGAENKQPVWRQRAVIIKPAIDRIKKAFSDFKAWIIGKQVGVVTLHAQKKIGIGGLAFHNAAQLLHHQPDMVIVEMDAAFHRLLDGVPVGLLEAVLRARGNFQKTTILRVKPLQDGLGDE